MEKEMRMNEIFPKEVFEITKVKQGLNFGKTQNVWPKAVPIFFLLAKKTDKVKWIGREPGVNATLEAKK